MNKVDRNFFSKGEILYCNLLKKGVICPFSRKVVQVMEENGVKVFDLNSSDAGEGREGLPKTVEHAYVLYNRDDEQYVINKLIQNHVKYALFHPFHTPSKEALDTFRANEIEAFTGCPNMVFGYGCCKAHALLL